MMTRRFIKGGNRRDEKFAVTGFMERLRGAMQMPTSPSFALNIVCHGCRHIGAVSLFGLALVLVGCETAGVSTSPPESSAIAPPRVDVTRNQAWRDAEALAALDKNRLTVIGAGASMRPVYGENTVLVIQKIPYGSLAPGMNVAYRNQRGTLVLHRLIAKDAGGWRAVGLNNPAEDRDRVTPENLLGIVYASFANEDVE